jgi:hypothetical protein
MAYDQRAVQSAVPGTNGDYAFDLLSAGQSPEQVAAWLRGRVSADQVSAFLSASSGGTGTDVGGPAGLAALFRQPDVTLPDSAKAKTDLRGLETKSIGGLSSLIDEDPEARRQKIQDAMYTNSAEGINYSGDRLAQDVKESQNSKNFLTSSATGDYFLDPIERNRALALERAGNDAFINSGAEVRADTASRSGLLGAAFTNANTGLQSEANVEASNRTANQNATTTGYQTGLQVEENALNREQKGSQFDRSLAQTKDLQEQSFANAKDINSSNAIGAGIGGLANLFAPSIVKALF